MAKKAKSDNPYMGYPQPDASESGCKVSWNYYRDEAKAKECAIAAAHNRERCIALGFDFGYCWPGNIELIKTPGKFEGMYCVTLP